MAQLNFSTHELVEIIRKNITLPSHIENIYAEPEGFQLRIKLKSLLPSISVWVYFESFSNDQLRLKLKTNGLIESIARFIELPGNDWMEIKPTEIIIKLNVLLRHKLRGLEVTHIDFEASQFKVTTLAADH
ncbi:MAG: hypothetical protein GF313_06115 [Caldithrix sp.]|nr:hypothetical protein [Caldithrix sp.]